MNQNEPIPYINPVEDEKQQFLIYKSSASTTPPLQEGVFHRHDYQTILWTKQGKSMHMVDGQSVTTFAHTLFLISRGQIHRLETLSQDYQGISIRFKDDFLPHTIVQTWNYQATLFNSLNITQPIEITEAEVPLIEDVMNLLILEQDRSDAFGRDDVLRQLLQYLLIIIERAYRSSLINNDPNDGIYRQYQRFLTLLEKDFTRHHGVKHYADQLHLSPRHLSDVSNKIIGKSVKQIIVDRLMLEAKRHLQFTTLSIKEIAYALGYESPIYFSQAFKQATKQSPTRYREAL